MIVSDGYFLTKNTEDKADIINNLCSHAKQNSASFLLCFLEGIFSSTNQEKIQEATDYINSLLVEEGEVLSVFNESGYALLQFRSPYLAATFAETYFFFKNEVDIPEKYVYCCVVDEMGSIYLENYKSPKLEPSVNISDILTPEEIEQKLREIS
jgi:hypothetical protein